MRKNNQGLMYVHKNFKQKKKKKKLVTEDLQRPVAIDDIYKDVKGEEK